MGSHWENTVTAGSALAAARGWKPREARTKVLIRASMRADGPKTEICVRDISVKGLLVQAERAPRRGTFVEILCGGQSIVGQVVWASERRFGVAARQRLDVSRIIGTDRGGAAADTRAAASPARSRRGPAPDQLQRRAERSRALSRSLQFLFLGATSAAAAAWIGALVYGQLAGAFEPVAARLGG